MGITLPLDRMTTNDKLQAMEALWVDLCGKNDEFGSPLWHGDILAEREKKLAEGKEKVYGWDDARERIRKAL